MTEMPDDFVGFFGCTHKGGGHNLESLSKWFHDTNGDWAAWLDSDDIMRRLRTDSFVMLYLNDVTIVGYPRSLVDHRGGSKTLFFWKGRHTAEEMAHKMEEYPWVYEIFQTFANRIKPKKED